MSITASAGTHVGLARKNNEDAFLADDAARLYIVCDGMGGHDAGEVASAVTVASIRHELLQAGWLGRASGEPELAGKVLAQAVVHAHDRVREESERLGLRTHMGTTVVAALVLERVAVIASVGDSRAYLLAGGDLRRLTMDHTVAQMYAEMGFIRREDVGRHPLRNVLVRSVGSPDGCEPDVVTVAMAPGDRLLLCTDGLTEMVSEKTMAAVSRGAPDVVSATGELIAQALAGGGRDNVTVILVEQGARPAVTEPVTKPTTRPRRARTRPRRALALASGR